MTAPSASTQPLDTWAVVEMFGHKKLAGHVTEHQLGGQALIRVDVPETRVGDNVVPAHTKLLGPASIYCMTPCSEAIGRAAAQSLAGWNPVIPVDLPRQLTAGSGAIEDAELTTEGDFDDDLELDDDEELNAADRDFHNVEP